MRCLQIKVVTGTVQIYGKQIYGIEAVLLAVRLRLHQQHLLGQAIRRVGLLGIAVPQVFFLKWNRRELGIRTDRANSHELAHTTLPGLVHQFHTHDQVIVKEFRRVFAIGSDATNIGGQMDNDQVFRFQVEG